MFERFTSRARRVMTKAQEEAAEREHPAIEPLHLAIAIASVDRDEDLGLFQQLGVNRAELLTALVEEATRAQTADGPPKAKAIPFAPESKRALEQSLRAALSLGHNYIGISHMTLGLIQVGGPDALVSRIDLETARTRLKKWGRDAPAERDGQRSTTRGFVVAQEMAYVDVTDRPTGSQDLLIGLVKANQTLAGKVLADLGITEEMIRAKIGEIGATGTLDEPIRDPEEIPIGDESLRITDSKTREVIVKLMELDQGVSDKLRELLKRHREERSEPDEGETTD